VGVVASAAANPAYNPDRHERRLVLARVPSAGAGVIAAPRVLRNRRRAGLVLIVDDSLHTRELYTEYLTFRGLGVLTAPDGEAGLTWRWR
jgi:hypothetical protein